jgi:hypothetical protein
MEGFIIGSLVAVWAMAVALIVVGGFGVLLPDPWGTRVGSALDWLNRH